MRVGIGLKARTGRAILVAVGGDLSEPRFIDRAAIKLLPDGAFAPYHVAAELEPAAARASVERDVAIAHQLAETAIRDATSRLTGAGHDVCGCGVLVGPGMPRWSTEEIVSVHIRMHQAEGELFRNVLVAGARACGLEAITLREKSVFDDAMSLLRLPRAAIDALLAELGKAAGAPWGKDQKEAAVGALAALAMKRNVRPFAQRRVSVMRRRRRKSK
jgi:hypothetical protein